MNELIGKLRAQVEAGKAAFGRLTQREQVIVLGGAGAFVLLVLFSVGMMVSSAIERAEHRVKVKTDQLTQVIQLQGEYRAREAQRQARMKELSRANLRLVSLIEDTARQAGVEIGQLRPDDSEPNPEGIVESTVDLRATNLSADRLQEFLSKLEKAPGVVILRRLKVQRPYRKDTVDLDMTVATYRMKT